MAKSFDQIELSVKPKVRFFRNDTPRHRFDHIEMAKKRRHRHPIWYVKEWMALKGLRQKDIVARTDFSKSQVSEYLTGAVRWNEDILIIFAHAIGVHDPRDLMQPPVATKNELAEFVMGLDRKKQNRALKLLRAALGDEDEKDDQAA